METFNEILNAWYLFVNSNLELITLTIVVILLTSVIVKVLRQDSDIKDLYQISEDNWMYISQIGLDRAMDCCVVKKKRTAKKK